MQGSAFLKSFGKPDRLLTCECERSEATTLAQAFQMINGETVRKKLELPANRIGKRLEAGAADSEILSEFYLIAVCREPKAEESRAVKAAPEFSSQIGGRRGKTWSGHCSIARNSCCGTDRLILCLGWVLIREIGGDRDVARLP